MTKVLLYEEKDLDTLNFPETEDGRYASDFLKAFMRDDTENYISNIKTKIYCLQVDHHFFPVTVNDREYKNSYVTSPYGVISYAHEELMRFNHWIITPLLAPVLKGVGTLLKLGKINRVVTVNNWLLSTNLYPELSKEQIFAATTYLQKIFPTHSILWRSLNNTCPIGFLDCFKAPLCRLIVSRQIYFYHPMNWKNLISKKKWNLKNDKSLLESSGYQVVKNDEIKPDDIPRIRQLYEYLYIEKYTPQNPQFTDAFITLAIEKKLLNILALKKDGIIDGVVGYFKRGNVMTTPLFGYDTRLDQKIGLYRMLTILCIDVAHDLGLLLHHSSGAPHFKRVRGMVADLEYTAVFDRHLSKKRQIVWAMLSAILNKIGRPMLIYFKL